MKKKEIKKLYSRLVSEIDYENHIEEDWKESDLKVFNEFNRINLFDYQIDSLKAIIKFLSYYFKDFNNYSPTELKINLQKELENIESSSGQLTTLKKQDTTKKQDIFKLLKDYYPTRNNNPPEIEEYNFLNRISIEMATGSGKSLVLIKLIELLAKFKKKRLIPDNDFLILTWNDNLVKQIKLEIETYNAGKEESEKIELIWLKEYENVKNNNHSKSFSKGIKVFFYRTNLITGEKGIKRIDFREIDKNEGKWYIILDEAHKGDGDTSKTQNILSILSRNGFLFNFSATLTDEIDTITTVYDFNLAKFIEKGYGKNIYISNQEVAGFKDEKPNPDDEDEQLSFLSESKQKKLEEKTNDFNEKEKQLIVLKCLINLYLVKMAKKNIKDLTYHNPLLIGFTRTTIGEKEEDNSDLILLFNEIRKILRLEIAEKIFKKAKEELKEEFNNKNTYLFQDFKFYYNKKTLNGVKVEDILSELFYSNNKSDLEIIRNNQDRDDIIFKAKNSNKPFCHISIGNMDKFLNKFFAIEPIEDKNEHSFFEELKKNDNEINILLGSRKFYEGWNVNRPNILLFINIGKQGEKFIKQAIGRGVRIEPIKNERRRIKETIGNQEVINKNSNEDIDLIETLFVYGTNKKDIEETLKSFMNEKENWKRLKNIKLNENREKGKLLIPLYKRKRLEDLNELANIELNKELVKDYIKWIKENKKLFYNKYYSYFNNKKEKHLKLKDIDKIFSFCDNDIFLPDADKLAKNKDLEANIARIIKYILSDTFQFEDFRELKNEIIHFKKIIVNLNNKNYKSLSKKVEKVLNYEDIGVEELFEKVKKEEITIEEFEKQKNSEKKTEFNELTIEKLENHLYIPILYSEEKPDYIKNIIDEESEVKFLNNLMKKKEKLDEKYEYWFFSKIVQNVDFNNNQEKNEIGPFPYTDSYGDKRDFNPDFIFWCKLKNSKDYEIIYVDPKGMIIGAEQSIKKYKKSYGKIFKENNEIKEFSYEDLKVKVKLFFYNEDKPIEEYEEYWTNIKGIFSIK